MALCQLETINSRIIEFHARISTNSEVHPYSKGFFFENEDDVELSNTACSIFLHWQDLQKLFQTRQVFIYLKLLCQVADEAATDSGNLTNKTIYNVPSHSG